MKKRERLLSALRHLLLGDTNPAGFEQPKSSMPPEGDVIRTDPQGDQTKECIPELTVTPMEVTQVEQATRQIVPTIDQFPEPAEEIKDLLRSTDWDEVNQGLELLVSTISEEQFSHFALLINAESLRIAHNAIWQSVLGINASHEINAVAKIASLTGALNNVTSIHLNRAQFADEIDFDLNLLLGATQLKELVVNGGSVQGLNALASLTTLQKLALLADNIEWDTDEHNDLFHSLPSLSCLIISQWPWEDLTPLSSLTSLARLDLRAGELCSLHGVDGLSTLSYLSLSDFYSLSSITEISALKQLTSLRLFNLSINSLQGLEDLELLSEIEIECSDLEDVSALGSLQALINLRLECGRQVVGLGSLASAPQLRQLKLRDIPEFTLGHDSKRRLGRCELDRLCTAWKDMKHRSRRISSLFAEGPDLGAVLIGLSVFEALADQISSEDFSQRLDQVTSRWGASLLSRAYWPQKSASSTFYPFTAPIGQWLNKASGLVDGNTISEIAELLAEYIPQSPKRT